MDGRLVTWARAVKARQKGGRLHARPVLFLFTDRRLADPVETVRRLLARRALRRLLGVIVRGTPEARRSLAASLRPLCAAHGVALLVAGDVPARGVGLHLPGGRGLRRRLPGRPVLVTAAAHDAPALRRARRAGADLAFLSPVFPTASHPGVRTLGAARFARLAAAGGLPVAALGGIDGRNARALARRTAGAGAIDAFCASTMARGA